MLLLLACLMFCDLVWGPTNDPGQKALFENGKQIGVWKLASREYLAFDGRRFTAAQCPVDPPDEKPEAKEPQAKAAEKEKPIPPEKCINYGLNLDELPKDGEFYSYNGEQISKGAAEGLLAGSKENPDSLKDDSKSMRLTIVGKDGKKAAESIKSDPRWKELGEGVVVKEYPADHWSLAGKGYKTLSPDKPSLYLTTHDGTLVYSGEDPGALFDRLRRQRDPFSIKWDSSWLSFNPFTWGFGIGWSRLHIPVEWVGAFIAFIVIAVLVTRKKPGPPASPIPRR